MKFSKTIAMMIAMGLLPMTMPALAEEAPAEATSVEEAAVETASIIDTQKLDASYTLALNAINAEDYETAKRYLDICFAYCDPQGNPTMYCVFSP